MDGKPIQSAAWGGFLIALVLVCALGLVIIFVGSVRAAGDEVFIVNNSGDDPDASIGDCVCQIASSGCTLRAAIQEANACSGWQTIHFNDALIVDVTSALPALSDDGTVIDGSDRWLEHDGVPFPGVTINGGDNLIHGLEITSAHNAVYGINIIKFGYNGVYLHGSAHDNIIGWTGFQQRNTISGNGQNGVKIDGASAVNNTVAGNYVGTNFKGTVEAFGSLIAPANGNHGISVWYGSGNAVAHNLVANNGWSGITVDAAADVNVEHNRVGLDVNGKPYGNVFYGVHIDHTALPVVAGNEIAFNSRGIHVGGGSDPLIQGNTIFSNTALAMSVPHGGGILVTGSSLGRIEDNQVLSNTAYFGSGIAVELGAYPLIISNTIRDNKIYTTAITLNGGGAGIYVSEASASIAENRILTNTLHGPGLASHLIGGGILLDHSDDVVVTDNLIAGNLMIGNSGGGGGIAINRAETARIYGNALLHNRVSSASYAGSAFHVLNDEVGDNLWIGRNWIESNSGGQGAVYLYLSQNITMTNNVIADNSSDGVLVMDSNANILLIHNTIADNLGSGLKLDDSHIKIYNTILASNSGYGMELIGAWSLIKSGNDVWGNGIGASFPGSVLFFMTEDPRFFDLAGKQFGLRPDSPCLNVAGLAYFWPNSINGVPRPQGAGSDVGAYEMWLLDLPSIHR